MTEEGNGRLLTSAASPPGRSWALLDASRPRRAFEHLTMSDVTPVTVDRLRLADVPPDSPWTLRLEVPVLVVDTFDACYVFERVMNKLSGFSRTATEAKWDLMGKLWGHRELLVRLESPQMAERLRLELEFLRAALRPIEDTSE